jgi:hypothetical protein
MGRPRKDGEKRVSHTFSLKPSLVAEVAALVEQTGNEDMSLSQFVELCLKEAINARKELSRLAPNLFTLAQEKPLKKPQKPLKKPSTIVVKRKGK